ncbi:MAG: hypothetical protein WC763_05295 [Candidatus Paceibacterota bacterium]|jgi:hypothetical protein
MRKLCLVCGHEEIVGDWQTGISHGLCTKLCEEIYNEWFEGRLGSLSLKEAHAKRMLGKSTE